MAAKAGEARRMVETPTTAACRTERRGYGRQLGINSAAVTLGGNLESNLDRGAAVGATAEPRKVEVMAAILYK